MTTKFKIGDKVQVVKDPTNYFIIDKIIITAIGIEYQGQGGAYHSWPEGDLELKKEKVKKYFYNFIDSDGELKLSNSKYTDDLHFQITNKNIKIFKRVDIGFIEVLT